ncbi:MAG: hypothetical protein HIU86_13470 [Acidobacteria bacterium]|nr:hypothetical protein [Acidobacteriota bacterium]
MTSVSASPAREADLSDVLRLIGMGSRSAFATLYDQMAPIVYGIAWSLLADPAVAERATEEVFLALWREAPRRERDHQDAAQWVVSITHRTVARHRS